jgi:hypothetical protein
MPRKFDFISPDIVLNEVDESVLPVEAAEVGPLLIGQTERGPAMKPVRITNLSDLYAIFGNPINGKGTSNLDVWREGNKKVPTYAMYAAQAHLASNSTPVTMVRLLGEADSNQSSGTRVGWKLNGKSEATVAANATAYGLFVMPSASATTNSTGSLAAIFYATGSALLLSGSDVLANSGQKATAQMIKSTAAGKFTMIVKTASGEGNSISFSFDPNAADYIRNQFNTNPQKIEASDNFNTTNESYWLGESYEQAFLDNVSGGSATGDQYAVMLPLQKGAVETGNWAYHQFDAQSAKTGYFLNRKVGGSRAQLFRLVAHSSGSWESKNLHVEIANLRMGNSQNPNSTFTIKIMQGSQELERYSNCNLDLTSEDFVAKRIGDQYQEWDATNKKYNVRGEYANVSDYVYVELAAAVANQTLEDAFALPVGFQGPLRHKGFSFRSGSANVETKAAAPSAQFSDAYVLGGNGIAESGAPASNLIGGLEADFTGSFEFPSLRLTNLNTNQGANYPASAVFGVRHNQGSTIYRDASYGDILRVLPNNITAANNSFELSFTFSLEEMAASNGLYYFNAGTMAYGEGQASSLQDLFDLGVKQFAAPMVGGFDGVDIKKVSPFSDVHIGGSDTSATNYVKHSIEKALDSVADPEVVEYEMIAMPGMTDTAITNRMIRICEDRGDAMAVVDLNGIYRHQFEASSQTNGAASTVIATANSRLLNSSYVATYYPSVRITDTANAGNNVLVVPPSVAAVGAIAKSQGASEPWFAPAGFNRGGINELGGSNGPRVNGTLEHLTKADRDNLYEVNINPIARFPASGNIVIFGQKTMSQTASALDRINVRRLLLHLKRRIGKVAETILFDQNVQSTWNRFKFQADQILSDVQSRLGITEYKLVLDETTTTADLVDRNILYAKVLIKPARAIEFIVVDFVVTRSGIEL